MNKKWILKLFKQKISDFALKIIIILLIASPVAAQKQELEDNFSNDLSESEVEVEKKDPMLLYDRNGLTIRSHLQFGINAVADTNLFWDFAEIITPESDFNSDTQWLEFYLKPGLSFEKKFSSGAVYGKISGVGSYTVGTDPYNASNEGSVTLEEGYLGYKSTFTDSMNFDFSIGPRELKLGTGMLIANGGSSGFDRGALKFGPRKAWDMAAIGRITGEDITGTMFYLSPNELPSSDNNNQLAGFDLRFDRPNGSYIGLTYLNVLESDDFFIEYNRIINRNIFLTLGFSVSVPGKGITSVFPGDDPLWTGGFVNVVFNF